MNPTTRIAKNLSGLFATLGCAILLAGVALAVNPLDEMPAVPLKAEATPLLETEEVGIAGAQSWVSKGPIFQTSTKQWRQMLVLKEKRDAREFRVATLTLDDGKLKLHPKIKGYGQSRTAWSGGKLYFTTWLPGGFHVYDPDTDTIRELPLPFENAEVGAFRMSVAQDGVVAMGAAAASELSMYDPGSGALTKFGILSDKHGYVYELGSDNDFIYAALRGKSPWLLVAVNKKTKARETILTAPVDGYINGSGTNFSTRVNMQDPNDPWQRYGVANGRATPLPADAPAAKAPEPVAEPPPKVLLDESPLFEGQTKIAIHYQDPKDENKWKDVRLDTPLASEPTLALTALDDGRITALGGPYNPAIVFDPKTGKGIQAPFAPVSGRCMVAIGPTVYASGYPSTTLMRWDTTKPSTSRVDLPGRPAIPDEDPRANPRLVAHFPGHTSSGGHMGVRMFKGPDGCVYIVTARHRHFLGFDVVWYNPADGTRGEIEDRGGNDHLAVSWASLSLDGKRLFLSTTVQTNRQLVAAVPAEARLRVVDLAERKYLEDHVPLPGFKALTGVAEVAPNKLVGLAPDAEQKTTFVYRYDLRKKKIEEIIRYTGLIQGRQGTTALPAKGFDFILGPDGKVWTGVSVAAEMDAILRIAPDPLEIFPLGRVPGAHRFLFLGGNLYVNGAPKIRRVSAARKVLETPRQGAPYAVRD
ncbi:MAG: hypothetical protein IT578_01720 [Verrucomicrobiae bacterium]|nr:hypothetical protein [Verrucomicrobiae bacterium]